MTTLLERLYVALGGFIVGGIFTVALYETLFWFLRRRKYTITKLP